MLGLPNSTTFGKRSFTNIERFVGPELQQLADEIVYGRNLVEEVKQVLGDRKDDNGTLLFELWKQKTLPVESWPRLIASGDMGWQGKGSGNSYNSLSGDAIFVGSKTRKPISWHVMGKGCSQCNGWNRSAKGKLGEPCPEHACRKTWNGSSGAMEPVALLNMFIELYNNHQVILQCIVTDDDSSIKSKLKWSNKDWMTNNNSADPPYVYAKNTEKRSVRPDYGRLPRNMPEPTFLADPNHRKKAWSNSLYSLEKKNKEGAMTITKMDVVRLGRNMAYMFGSLVGKTDDEMIESSKAVIEHHFDNHEHCGAWCHRKATIENGAADTKKKYYRCKDKDAKLYKALWERIERFITLEALQEVSHGMNTLMNESFNNTVSWVAPKNKVYSLSDSLQNRMALALGINGLGMLAYCSELLHRLGIEITSDVKYWLTQQSTARDKRIALAKTPDAKKKRVRRHHDHLLVKTVIAKRERAIREGQHKSLRGLDGVYTEEELAIAQKMWPGRRTNNAAGTPRQRPNKADQRCNTCNATGHGMVTSKACKHHEAWKLWRATNPRRGTKFVPPSHDSAPVGGDAAAAEADTQAPSEQTVDATEDIEDTPEKQLKRDADECDKLDCMDLDCSSDDDDLDCFFDAYEYDTDG